MLKLICLTKTYRLDDFALWLKYHLRFGCEICILDNESPADVSECVLPLVNENISYNKISGFADQWNLFGDIMNNKTDLHFNNGDLVIFLDDDEYLWYDETLYSSLECALRAQYKQLSCLLLPEILMSTHHITHDRSQLLPLASYYRRNDFASQGKACVMWNEWTSYSFNLKNFEIGHVPWINGTRMSDVVGSGVTKTTYGVCKYDAPVRLYHYHIKSEADWRIKIERGSAAIASEPGKNGSYSSEITQNKKFGKYDIPDLTMKLAVEKMLKNS